MLLFDAIAESRIAEALEQGVFDDLPGAGQPLALDDESLIAPELRVAWRVLRNAGCLPPELELRREIHEVGQLLDGLERNDDPDRYDRTARRLALLRLRLGTLRGDDGPLFLEGGYRDALLRHLHRNGGAR